MAYPWAIRRGDKSDFNDTMQTKGVEAVAARIEPTLYPEAPRVERVPTKRARELLAGFVERAREWVPSDGHIPAPPPPVEATKVDVGAGKSEAVRRGVVRLWPSCGPPATGATWRSWCRRTPGATNRPGGSWRRPRRRRTD